MKNRKACLPLTAVLLLLTSLSVLSCEPKYSMTDAQMKALSELDELMWFLATVTDPGFDLEKQVTEGTMTDKQFARFVEIGRRVKPAAGRLIEPGFSKGEEFDRLGGQLEEKAESLQAAAAGKDEQAVLAAIRDMKNICAACHEAHR